MRKIALLSAGLAGMLTLILPATPARALSLVTFVSPTGDDFHFNDCSSSTTPCRTFSHAIQNTIPGGEIFCVPGVFDPRSPLDGLFQNFFTIAQSVTIDCGGGMGISFGFITINGPGIVVKLRNLKINGGGLEDFEVGINAINMAALFIENCQISGFTAPLSDAVGIKFAPDGVAATLHVSDSVITSNGLADSGGGILIRPTGLLGFARVVIERTRVENNTHGIVADGHSIPGLIIIQIDGSMVAASAGNGIWAKQASIVVDRTSSKNNFGFGILADGSGSLVHLGNSTVAGNRTGLGATDGGQILSYQNNQTKGNGLDGEPTGVLSLN